mmetsp:Transcript_64039/g.198265  ORF Transcript_64039/g.198265 Transcript_64039/m.198265 type:complete len:310 (-) Transcript_64039:97-1026(-)
MPKLLARERSGRWSPSLESISMRPMSSFNGFRARCLSKPMFFLSVRSRVAEIFTPYCPGWKYVSCNFGSATDILAKSQLGFRFSCEHCRSPSSTPSVKVLWLKVIPAALTMSGLELNLAISHWGARGRSFSGDWSSSSTLTALLTRWSHGCFSSINRLTSLSTSIAFRLLEGSRSPKSPPGPEPFTRGWHSSSFGRYRPTGGARNLPGASRSSFLRSSRLVVRKARDGRDCSRAALAMAGEATAPLPLARSPSASCCSSSGTPPPPTISRSARRSWSRPEAAPSRSSLAFGGFLSFFSFSFLRDSSIWE